MELQGNDEERIAWAIMLGSVHEEGVEEARREADR